MLTPKLLFVILIIGGLMEWVGVLLAATPAYDREAWHFDSERAHRELECGHGYEVDHIVPLHGAHLSGGADWTPALKRSFANDPSNWWCIPRTLNRSKSDSTLADWHGGSCRQRKQIAAATVLVKTRWALNYLDGELGALRLTLARTCPNLASPFWCRDSLWSALFPDSYERRWRVNRCGGLGN